MAQNRSKNTYQKIDTIFKRDANNIIMPYDSFVSPELEWLRGCKFDAEEKIDGTNTRIEVTRENILSDIGNVVGIKWSVAYRGKTDNAEMPKMLGEFLKSNYPIEKVLTSLGLREVMRVTDEDLREKGWTVESKNFQGVFEFDFTKIPEIYTIYGEGFGAGIQSGGYYQKDQKFIGFDVKVNDVYLLKSNRDEILTKLGAPIVPFIGQFTIDEAIDFVKKGFNSNISQEEHLAEGLVLRSPMGVKNRRGERIIFKVKTCDFIKYRNKYGTDDKVDQPVNTLYNN